jgi:hypothetical protein
MHDASHSYYDKRVIGITCIAQLPVPVEAVAFVWQRHLFLPSEAVQPDSTMKINSISASLAKVNFNVYSNYNFYISIATCFIALFPIPRSTWYIRCSIWHYCEI